MRMLQTIDRNAEQLQRVAEDLLADPGAGRGLRVAFTELDLNQLAGEAVHAIQTSATVAGIVLSNEPGDEVPIFGDPTRLHQLLGNLLSNAIKFSPGEGGCTSSSTASTPTPGCRSSTRARASPRASGTSSSSASTGWRRRPRWACPGTGLGPGDRQVGGRGPRGFPRHRGHAGVVDDVPGVPAAAHDGRVLAHGVAPRTLGATRGRARDVRAGGAPTSRGSGGLAALRGQAARKPPDWWAHSRL